MVKTGISDLFLIILNIINNKLSLLVTMLSTISSSTIILIIKDSNNNNSYCFSDLLACTRPSDNCVIDNSSHEPNISNLWDITPIITPL